MDRWIDSSQSKTLCLHIRLQIGGSLAEYGSWHVLFGSLSALEQCLSILATH